MATAESERVMKKPDKKPPLKLTTETLQTLTAADLTGVAGGYASITQGGVTGGNVSNVCTRCE